uniref:DUF6904 family protein n=1 Tax=Citrobacter portucalensis TaxID=1639133 RepID=UPI0040553DEF
KSAQIREILISESAWEEMTCLFAPSLTVKYASDSDFNFIEDNIDSRCCYFISLSPEQRKKQLISIVRSFHSLWGKYAREKQDIKMLNEMNNTSWVWPDNINW